MQKGKSASREEKQQEVARLISELNGRGLKDSGIAKRCGVGPSQVHNWKKDQTPNPESFRMLQALTNRRLEGGDCAKVLRVAKGIKLALNQNWQETFLVEAITKVLSKASLSYTQQSRLESIKALAELNQLTNEDAESYIEDEVDKELEYKRPDKFSFRYNSFIADELFILPSSYQRKASSLLADLDRHTKEVEKYHTKLKKNKQSYEENLERQLYRAFSKAVEQHYFNDEETKSLKEQFQSDVNSVFNSFSSDSKYGFFYTHHLSKLLKVMRFACTYIYESKYQGINALTHEPQMEIYEREIEIPDDVVTFDEYERAITDAKSLYVALEEFISWQKVKYNEITLIASERLGLSKKLSVEKLFKEQECQRLISGELISVSESTDLNKVAESLFNRNSRKYTFIFAGEKYEVDLVELLGEWLQEAPQEVAFKLVQVPGSLVYPSAHDEDTSFSVFRIMNKNLLVTFERCEVFGSHVSVMRKELCAFEVVEAIDDLDLRESVKMALLKHGYVFDDVEVIN